MPDVSDEEMGDGKRVMVMREQGKKQDSKKKNVDEKKNTHNTLSARGIPMSMSLLPPPACMIPLPIAVTHRTARVGRKRRTQRRRDPRIRTRNRIRRNRRSVNAFRRLSLPVPMSVGGRQRMTSLLILMWRRSVERWPMPWSISSRTHRSADRRRRSRPNGDIAG